MVTWKPLRMVGGPLDGREIMRPASVAVLWRTGMPDDHVYCVASGVATFTQCTRTGESPNGRIRREAGAG